MVFHFLSEMLLSSFDSSFQIVLGAYSVLFPSLKFSI